MSLLKVHAQNLHPFDVYISDINTVCLQVCYVSNYVFDLKTTLAANVPSPFQTSSLFLTFNTPFCACSNGHRQSLLCLYGEQWTYLTFMVGKQKIFKNGCLQQQSKRPYLPPPPASSNILCTKPSLSRPTFFGIAKPCELWVKRQLWTPANFLLTKILTSPKISATLVREKNHQKQTHLCQFVSAHSCLLFSLTP